MKKKIYTRPISVTLTDCTYRQIYEIAEKEEISMSEYIREAIQEKFMKSNCSSITSERRTEL